MNPSAARTRPLLRTSAVTLVLAVALVGVVGCRTVRAGTHCSAGFGQQGNMVLVCKKGRWTRWATKSQVARLIAAAKANSASASGSVGSGGAGSTGGGPVATGFSPASAVLPSDASCAAAVKPATEVRADNTTANHTRGTQKSLTSPYPLFSRVDGNFVGTTDEIIQWAACKWGFDADVLRAQVAVESWWHQDTLGGWQSNASLCVLNHPIGADGHAGQCPLSGGLLALTYNLYKNGFPEAMSSSAYALDYVLAWWRSCYTGQVTWLNTVERGHQYAAGDAWGCIGTWNSGRWYAGSSADYVSSVQKYLSQRIWTTSGFLHS